MAKAYIALGSNLGDRAALLRAAVERLRTLPDSQLVATSSFQEYPAEDAPAGSPAFLNGVAEIETNLPPDELIRLLLEIERDLGRARGEVRNAARTLDLDILLYDQLVMSTERLTIPHPRMSARRFVLEPLAGIAPEAYHPVAGKTIRQLLAELPPNAGARA